ncbi:MAG: BlaI/MecI/CopY family transcriptional regulator [Gracilimonas sp.]|uniref:BlaI/MecI/CopY family transcriptional regulator n=1 Tax=Gracilimonas TaxID=649462 RepID=UPI001B0CDD71|nr:BlaI/MecI/CopY family transcriptional regulator [Gracilimonas sp.]MBO6585041.1 BlaI/MecI/CopY family transcriptional regulator [Gracilimonas sp.]MBO6615688.1 BlaI/MecI/CopY family transcriptional regulator [Gracilimonas sp.]
MSLTQTEEELMQYLWKLEKAFMKDLLELYPEPKPAPTTVATLLKRMTEKGFVGYEQMGRSRQYVPLVKKSEYFSKHVNGIIKKFFNNSASQFASFFTSETDLSAKELEELKAIVEKEIERKNQ